MGFKGTFILLSTLALIGVGGWYGWQYKQQKAAEARQDTYLQAAQLMADGKIDTAAGMLEQLHADPGPLPADKQAHVLALLVDVYEIKGDDTRRREVLDEILSRFPKSEAAAEAILEQARAAEDADPKEARELYQRLRDEHPTGAWAFAARAGQDRLLYRAGDIEEVRADLLALVDEIGDPEDEQLRKVRFDAYDLLSRLHSDWLFSPQLDPLSQNYVVQSGDTLTAIANKFDTEWFYLRRVNNLASASALRLNTSLKVPKPGGVYLVVDKSDFRTYMYRNDGTFLKAYHCGIGKLDYKTQAGEYWINVKEENPVWRNPSENGKAYSPGDPGYALGEADKTAYWMGLAAHGDKAGRTGLGIHGTNEPETVGTASSAGCIRMVHDDIEELFVFVPLYTKVIIQP